MTKYAIFFSYTPGSLANMMENPTDRSAEANAVAAAVGGTVESYYWMFGDSDGFVVLDVPDSVSAGAISVAAASSGAFASMETHELFTAQDQAALLEKAKTVANTYSPPTA